MCEARGGWIASSSRPVSELVLAAFAAAHDAHAVERETRTARFAAFSAAFDERAYRRTLANAGIRWLARSDPEFPPLLAAVHDPPPGLFLRGARTAELLAERAVAIVGARSCSDYGAHVARSLARELAAAGVVVISGLARGIDGWAHRGSLDAGGKTVAVLGCGVDRDYPRAHSELASRIAETGVIVSEYPPGVAPAPWRFPARNRIVAGLAAATVVVEARERSGALITADFALEEGREVLAVPGEITAALSRGTNALLRLGATVVTEPGDVLEAIGLTAAAGNPDSDPPPGSEAAAVLAALDAGAATADELVRAVGLTPAETAAALTELELAGLVSGAAGVYRR
jgi:DNA processing protein